jgi:signal peptidase II
MPRITRRLVIFVAMFLVTLAVDQGSKVWARTLPTNPPSCATADLAAGRCVGVPQPVIEGMWDWRLAQNDGAAFSSFRGSRIILTLIAMFALVGLGITAAKTLPEQRLKRLGLAMIAGGALGNLVDRVREGAVTDFVQWHYHGHYWPIFNVADVALLAGVGLLLVESFLGRKRPARLAT